MDLKAIHTEALIEELTNRENVKKIAVGPYQNYRLETKYEPDGTREILSDTVLVCNAEFRKEI